MCVAPELPIQEDLGSNYTLVTTHTFIHTWLNLYFRALSYVTVVTPFRVSFILYDDIQWIIFDILIDTIFIIDIFVNFFSAYYDHQFQIIIDNKLIAKTYLKSWFILDFVSVLPLSYLMQTYHGYSSLTRLSRLPRLYRLFKIAKLDNNIIHPF